MSKKSNLFKFVTLRNPQLIDEDHREQGVIEYIYPQVVPEGEGGNQQSFFHGPSITEDIGSRDSLLKASITNFRNQTDPLLVLPTKADIKAAYPELLKFSTWLAVNKHSITVNSINQSIEDIYTDSEDTTDTLGVADSDYLRIWDNLIYQSLSGASETVREILINMIVANAFLKKYNTEITLNNITDFTQELEDEFKRRARAQVIIAPNYLISVNKEADSIIRLSSMLTERLGDEMEVAMANENKKHLRAQIEEVTATERENMLTLSANFETVYNDYLDAVRVYKANPDNQVMVTRTLPSGETENVVTFPNLHTDIVFNRPVLGGSSGSVAINTNAGTEQAEEPPAEQA